jgi:hypothetical protein
VVSGGGSGAAAANGGTPMRLLMNTFIAHTSSA